MLGDALDGIVGDAIEGIAEDTINQLQVQALGIVMSNPAPVSLYSCFKSHIHPILKNHSMIFVPSLEEWTSDSTCRRFNRQSNGQTHSQKDK